MRRAIPYIGFLAVLVVLVGLWFLAPRAYAEDSSSSAAAAAAPDYSQALDAINAKLDRLEDLADSDDVAGLVESVGAVADGQGTLAERIEQAIAPMDSDERLQDLNELISAVSSLQVFQWVTLLLLLGVLCALVFLVSYRSHT